MSWTEDNFGYDYSSHQSHAADAFSYAAYEFLRNRKQNEEIKLNILPNRDYKSIECLRDHETKKNKPTKRLEQCFDVQDAQIVE